MKRLCAILILVSTTPLVAQAQQEGMVERPARSTRDPAQEHPGEAAYAKVCETCHGPEGRGDLAPPLVPFAWDADYVLAVVHEGYGQMPPISTRELTDEEVLQVVEYLESLSRHRNARGGHR